MKLGARACGFAVPVLTLLAACGGGPFFGAAEPAPDVTMSAARVHVGAGIAMVSHPPGRLHAGDVRIDSCELNREGAAVVGATVTNAAATALSYVATVEISQDDKRVDGVGLIVTRLERGRSVRAEQTGVRTGLRGPVDCSVVDVGAVAG